MGKSLITQVAFTPGDIDFIEEVIEFFQELLDAVSPAGEEDDNA